MPSTPQSVENSPLLGPLAEYRGQLKPHIQRIMNYMSTIYPPLVYPPTGSNREDPRQPFALPKWELGSSTSPGGRKQAEPMQQGVYFIGDRWPSTSEAPQAIYWIPPGEDACRYAATGDTTGTSRGRGEPDWEQTREYPEGNTDGHPFSRTGMLIQPWTVLCWGNDWEDTEMMQHWVASSAHDVERSQPDLYGESWTVTRGGWVKDKPGDRGAIWKLTVNLAMPIVRQKYNRTGVKSFGLRERIVSTVPTSTPEGPAKPD